MPNDAVCDNGLFCDGDETCSASVGCLAGADPCSGQECDEGNDTCGACVNAGQCDDGLVCTGVETCVDNACVAGTPVVCNDNVACTVDSCDEPGGECLFVPDDDSCDNGVFCDGAETCNVNSDCQAPSGVACPGQSCNEGGDVCEDTALESGSVNVGGSLVTVPLLNTYISPVVVTTMQYVNNTKPMVTRVSSVTPTSFKVRLQNPLGVNTPATENVSYLVVEKGTWTIDGVAVEAQTYDSSVTDEDGSWVGEVQSYNQSYKGCTVLSVILGK